MRIDHFAVYVKDLEAAKAFYEKYFGVKSNLPYFNPKTGLKTYFLTFEGGGRLEIMTRPGVADRNAESSAGYAHLAVSVGSKDMVDQITNRLRQDGYTIISGPRTTGDGYYESCVLDPENNQIEIVV